MNWKSLGVLALVILLVVTAGCAHRQHVRAGDEAMERNEPREAVQHYRTAHRMRPNSQKIFHKLDRAEEEVLDDALNRIGQGMAGDDADEAMEEALGAAQLLEDPERLEMLERRAERIVLEETARRREIADYAGALALIEIHIEAFGDPLEPIAQRERVLRAEWFEVLRERGDAHMVAGRAGAAALYFAKANSIVRVGDGGVRAEGAYERVLRTDSWGVKGVANFGEPSLSRILGGLFDEDLPAAIKDARQTDVFGLEARLRISVPEPEFLEWEEAEIRSGEYQSGTEWVPNPEYEAAQQRALDAEERVVAAERDVSAARRDLREAERALRNAEREGKSTSIEEGRVDRAARTLDRRERTLDDRRYDQEQRYIELRRIEQFVEEPVYSRHNYEVILQKADMYGDVFAEVEVDPRGFSASVDFEVDAHKTTEYHEAQPVLQLASRYDPPPSRQDLRELLDRETAVGIAAFLDEAFQMYREKRLGDLEHTPRERAVDAMARFVLLDPRKRDADLEKRLAEMTGFDDAADLLVRLARSEARVE